MSYGKAIFLPNRGDPRGCAYTAALLKQVTSPGSAGRGAGGGLRTDPGLGATPIIGRDLPNKMSASASTPQQRDGSVPLHRTTL